MAEAKDAAPRQCEWEGCSKPAISYWREKQPGYLLKPRPVQLRFCSEHHALAANPSRAVVCNRRKLQKSGYVVVKVAGEWIAEHRWVMERMLGRPLQRGENVHHRNGLRSDNRPENLELWAISQPYGQRFVDLRCPHCGKSYHETPGPGSL